MTSLKQRCVATTVIKQCFTLNDRFFKLLSGHVWSGIHTKALT